MKKLTTVFLLLIGLGLTSAFSQTGNVAVGPVFSGNLGALQSPIPGLGITGKIPNLPPIFGLNFSLGSKSGFFGMTADWWLYKQTLYAPANVSLYAGPGFFGDIYYTEHENPDVDFGFRVPFGINWVPIKVLETFVEVAPAFGVQVGDPTAPTWRIQASIGARFWF